MRGKIEKLLRPFQVGILYVFDSYFQVVKSKDKVIFVIGVDEIANCTSDLNNIFKKESLSVNFTTNKFYKNNNYDYSMSVTNKCLIYFIRLFYGPYLLAKLSNQSDIFIYFWNTGFCLDRAIDYKFLRSKKKKIVCLFLGSDIRSHILRIKYHMENNLDTGSNYMVDLDNALKHDNIVKKIAKDADTYADLIFNHPKDQISYLKSEQIIMPYMFNKNKMRCTENKFKNLKDLIIVHASSRPIAKGTPIIRAAIKKLEIEGYKFKYIEFFNNSNEEVINTLYASHILINELYAFVPGVLGIEGMATCNATITSAEYDGFPKGAEYAWLQTRYWEVYDNLKYLLDNPKKIEMYAKNGYEFVKNNYTEEKVRQFYIDTFYEHKIIDDKNIFQK